MQQIRIDFDNPGLPQSLGAVEGESQSRIFQVTLYKSGAAYTAPAGAVYSIMYRGFGPQNQGWYDTIEDGAGKRAACTVSGNVVTCELARQALRVPGHLTVVLCVSDAKGKMLKSWPINADVRNDGYEDTGESEMYFNLSGIAGNYLTQLEKAMANAETTRNNLISTSAQAKKDIDAKAAEALKSIPESYTELDGNVKQLEEDIGYAKYILNLEWHKGAIDSKGIYIEDDSLYYFVTLIDVENLKKIRLDNMMASNGSGTIAFYTGYPSADTLISFVKNDNSINIFSLPNEVKMIAIAKAPTVNTTVIGYIPFEETNKLKYKQFKEIRWNIGRCNAAGEILDTDSQWYVYTEPIFVKEIKKVKIEKIYNTNSTVSTITFFDENLNNIVQTNVMPTYNVFDVPYNATTMIVTSNVNYKNDTVISYSEDSNFDLRYNYIWRSEYDKTLEKLQGIESSNDCTSFIFLTDLHYSPIGRDMAEHFLGDRLDRTFCAIKKMCDEYPIKQVVCGGDYQQLWRVDNADNPQRKQDGIDNLYRLNNWLSTINAEKIAICGNHEGNYTGDGTGFGLTISEIYNYLTKKYIKNDIKKANNQVFYKIDSNDNVCYIYINTLEQNEYTDTVQSGINFVCEQNVSKYPCIIINHFACDNNGTVYQPVKNVIDQIKGNGVNIYCWIGGHNHADWAVNYNGVPVITCLQSGAITPLKSQDGIVYSHIDNVETESAFTIITIDKNNKKIYCTRYGLGNDRLVEI